MSGHSKAAKAFEKADGDWRIELHTASAAPFAPPAHCLSRVADHIDSPPSPFDFAKATSSVASSTVKTSEATSFTPIIGVTATAFHAAPSLSPSTLLTWAWVAVAACTA